MSNSSFYQTWSIIAVRLIILVVFLIEGSPSFLVCGLMLVAPVVSSFLAHPTEQHTSIHLEICSLIVTVGLLTLFAIAAQCSFMLAIRFSQQILGIVVNAGEFALGGYLSINGIIGIGSYLTYNSYKKWLLGYSVTSVCVSNLGIFFLFLLLDFLLCVVINLTDRRPYVPSYSVLPKSSVSQVNGETLVVPDLIGGIRELINQFEFKDPAIAVSVARMIPESCPFERTINFFGWFIVYIPPLCKLNPLYEEITFLRFRALSYLADNGYDILAL